MMNSKSSQRRQPLCLFEKSFEKHKRSMNVQTQQSAKSTSADVPKVGAFAFTAHVDEKKEVQTVGVDVA